jgi:hypothetical protein
LRREVRMDMGNVLRVPVTQVVRVYGFYFVYVMGAGVIAGVDEK